VTYHFWKAVFKGGRVASVLSVLALCVALALYGSEPLGGEPSFIVFSVLATATVSIFGTMYAFNIYRKKEHVERMRNLDRVHPLPFGHRRWNA